MRVLTLLALILGCSDPELVGASQSSSAIEIDPGCTTFDLRIYPGTQFRGTPLCLAGTGTFTALHTYFPQGIGSVIGGLFNANFYTTVHKGHNVDACTSYPTVSSQIHDAASVTTTWTGSDLLTPGC
jgi:hypothetical protein